jgi:hypothetical protein
MIGETTIEMSFNGLPVSHLSPEPEQHLAPLGMVQQAVDAASRHDKT